MQVYLNVPSRSNRKSPASSQPGWSSAPGPCAGAGRGFLLPAIRCSRARFRCSGVCLRPSEPSASLRRSASCMPKQLMHGRSPVHHQDTRRLSWPAESADLHALSLAGHQPRFLAGLSGNHRVDRGRRIMGVRHKTLTVEGFSSIPNPSSPMRPRPAEEFLDQGACQMKATGRPWRRSSSTVRFSTTKWFP